MMRVILSQFLFKKRNLTPRWKRYPFFIRLAVWDVFYYSAKSISSMYFFWYDTHVIFKLITYTYLVRLVTVWYVYHFYDIDTLLQPTIFTRLKQHFFLFKLHRFSGWELRIIEELPWVRLYWIKFLQLYTLWCLIRLLVNIKLPKIRKYKKLNRFQKHLNVLLSSANINLSRRLKVLETWNRPRVQHKFFFMKYDLYPWEVKPNPFLIRKYRDHWKACLKN